MKTGEGAAVNQYDTNSAGKLNLRAPNDVKRILKSDLTITALSISIELVSGMTITEKRSWHIDTDLLAAV